MDKSRLYPALAIMLGLIIMGLMLPISVSKLRSFERTVNVKGLCEREVPADKVIWPLAYKLAGNDFQTLASDIEKKNAILISFLIEGGVTDEEITVGLPSFSDKDAQEYGSNDRVYRYIASCVITVCSKDVDKVMKLMSSQSQLTKNGLMLYNDWETKSEFSFEGLNELKPEMIEEATKNAREVALKFAKDSESHLGKIKEATQGTFSISDRDSQTPQIKKVRVVTNVTYYLTK